MGDAAANVEADDVRFRVDRGVSGGPGARRIDRGESTPLE